MSKDAVMSSDPTAAVLLDYYLQKAYAQQKYQYRLAKLIKWSLNFVIILQVFVAALVTIVSALEPSQRTRIATAALGALGTMTASLIARAKGTNQPELAETHAREMEKFIGQCKLYIAQVGDTTGPEVNEMVEKLAQQFDTIEDRAAMANRGREIQPSASYFMGTPETTAIAVPAATLPHTRTDHIDNRVLAPGANSMDNDALAGNTEGHISLPVRS